MSEQTNVQYSCKQGTLTKVPFGEVHHNPDNPRFRESMDGGGMWSAIVAAGGLLVALVCHRVKEGYRTLQGGRRLSGLEYGWTNDRERFLAIFKDGMIPAIVHEGLSTKEARSFLVDHNTKNLRRPEMLRAVRILRLNGETMAQMADRFGRKQGTIQPLLRLLDLESVIPEITESWTKYAMGWESETTPKMTNEVIQGLQKAYGEAKDTKALTEAWAKVKNGEISGIETPKPKPWSKVESLFKELPEGKVKAVFAYVYNIDDTLDGPGLLAMAKGAIAKK